MVLVPVEFTDRFGSKRRPAVIVSSDRYHDESPEILIASITSNLGAVPHPGDQILHDWREAGLLRPSLVQTKVATIQAMLAWISHGGARAQSWKDVVGSARGFNPASPLDHGLHHAFDLV